MIEGLGVFASVLVFISFLFNNATAIRAVNVLGAILFVVYGIAIDAFSVWFLNGGLVLVHIYYMIKAKKDGRK